MEKKGSLQLGIFITVVAYFCFAIGSSSVRAIGSALPTFEIVFFQNFVSLIFIIPYCIYKKTLNFKKSFLNFHLVRDICGVGSYICYFAAITQLNLVDATVLAYSAPFYTPIIWSIWRKERVGKDVWWTIVLGFIGIACILKPTSNIFKPGALLGIGAGILSAAALVSLRILNQRHASLSRSLFYYFLVSTIITLPLLSFSWVTPTMIQWGFLALIGAATISGQLLLTIAYRHGTASFLSPLSYSIVIFILFISWVVFGQRPPTLSFIGAGLVVLGGTLTFFFHNKAEGKSPKETFMRKNLRRHFWEFWKNNDPKE